MTRPTPQEPIFAALLSSLDKVVFERVDEGAFAPLTEIPEWLAALCPDLGGSAAVRLGETFPFLDAFLFDAEEHWSSEATENLESGPWIEVDGDGAEQYLEATVTTIQGRRLLVVERPTVTYEQYLAAIQTGRETSLDRDRMVRDSQRKEVLLHCIVHDLKGPLSGIVGALAMLQRKAPAEAKEMVEIGQRGASRLDMLIQGILSAFKAEIDALESFEFDAANAPSALACASDAAISMAPAFRMAGVELELDPDLDPTGDWRVVAEKVRLDRVVANLLGNALRYSPRGSAVRIGLARDDERVRFSIEDRGPGVAEDARGGLFKKFSQGKTKAGSAGLGLYFCRITVERWGGEIGYEPRDGGGSRFWFTLLRPSDG